MFHRTILKIQQLITGSEKAIHIEICSWNSFDMFSQRVQRHQQTKWMPDKGILMGLMLLTKKPLLRRVEMAV